MVVRAEIGNLPEYKPGVGPEELLRQLGVTSATNVIRLHNNEEPWEPFPDASVQRLTAWLPIQISTLAIPLRNVRNPAPDERA